MIELSPKMPKTQSEAFAHIAAVKAPTIDDLKVMMLLEASAKGLYYDLADEAPNQAVADLLRKNGDEELKHAHRVRDAIEKLTGENVQVPSPEQNPYCEPPKPVTMTAEMLQGLAQTERDGETLYESWASSLNNEDAAALLRMNAKEERGHSERVQRAVERLTT